jgi:hypothetical protein
MAKEMTFSRRLMAAVELLSAACKPTVSAAFEFVCHEAVVRIHALITAPGEFCLAAAVAGSTGAPLRRPVAAALLACS